MNTKKSEKNSSETVKEDGYPFVNMLENRLTEIEESLNMIIREIDKPSYSPMVIKMSAIAGLTAVSAAKDFLPVLTVRKFDSPSE